MSVQASALILAWFAILALTFGFAGLVRSSVRLSRVVELSASSKDPVGPTDESHLPPTSVMPASSGLAGLLAPGRTLAVLCVSPTCLSCQVAADTLIRSAAEHPVLDVAVVSRGNCLPLPGNVTCLARADDEMAWIRPPATPYLLFLSEEGRVLTRSLAQPASQVSDSVDHAMSHIS